MADLFKGYVLTKDKVPLQELKDVGKYLKEPPSDHDYGGVLKEEYVQVDFDTEEDAIKMLKLIRTENLKCDVLRTTRGIHAYFKNDGKVVNRHVGVFNAMGIKCDIGIGSKLNCIPLRTTKTIEDVIINNGVEEKTVRTVTKQREWQQKYDDLEIIPPYLRPLDKIDRGFKNCDGRNDALFRYILDLQKNEYSMEEIRQVLRMINRYVFSEPLTDRELNTIMREDAFDTTFFFDSKGRFLHNIFGNYMLSNNYIVRIEDMTHIYTNDGLYSSNTDEFEKQMIAKIPSLKDSQRKEVYKYIGLRCNKEVEFSHPRYLGLRNFVLDIQTKEIYPYSPAYVIPNKIRYAYREDAYNEDMDKTLNKVCCNDPEIRALLEEMIGYTLFRKNTMQVCFILTGEGSNGKSTMLNCIKQLLGRGNYTSLDLRELEENFKPAELFGKLANIGDDISAKFLEGSSVFKKCVTGNTFLVSRKYGQPFQLDSYATQIFCANELPQVRDKSDGFSRRIVLVPFNAKFSKTDVDYDPYIEEKLLSDSAMEYLLKLALDGLERVLVNKTFTKSERSETEKAEYIRSNNNILEYIEDMGEDLSIYNQPMKEVYEAYDVWCIRNGCSPVKKLNFNKEIYKIFNCHKHTIKNADRKTVNVYKENE